MGRLATGMHPSLRVIPGDTVVLSSHTIPGNEETVHRVINRLFQKGANVIYHPVAPVHVSGHASQEEQKFLISILQPKFFVPIHGELRQLDTPCGAGAGSRDTQGAHRRCREWLRDPFH